MKRQQLAALKKIARLRFFNLQVYRDPIGSGWIAHGIDRKHRIVRTARGGTQQEALEALLGMTQVEVPS